MSAPMKRVFAWIPMLTVVVLALRTAAVWDRLPAVMMSHFDARGVANGWSARNEFIVLMFVLVGGIVALLALISDRVGRRRAVAGWAFVVMTWAVAAFMAGTFWATLDANLYHTRLAMAPQWIIAGVVVPLAFAIGIDWRWWLSRQRREAARSAKPAQVVAEEQHGSAVFAGVFFGGAVLLLLLAVPAHNDRGYWPVIGLIVGAVALVLSGFWALRGFTYRFTTAGVEIRTLGIRLRRIPLSQITEYDVQRCNPLTDFGGWGVKGFGNETAYIWGGHTGLRIKTASGDVYLGHREPQRLLNDLNRIMKYAH